MVKRFPGKGWGLCARGGGDDGGGDGGDEGGGEHSGSGGKDGGSGTTKTTATTVPPPLPLPRGAFIAEYAGEPLRTAEARRRLAAYDARGAGHALLSVRAVLPSGAAALRLSLDATARGNAARFANHACGGGACALVLVARRGELLPRVALFAARAIAAGEEITFDYGGGGGGGGGDIGGGGDGGAAAAARSRQEAAAAEEPPPARAHSSVPCACGAPCCRGWLPSEVV